ncbi:MAG: zinc ribbon domain-containing protein [Nitrososphaerales archaeon]
MQNRANINQNNRVNSILHKVSKVIVAHAKRLNKGIILEDIKGVRNSINKKVFALNKHNGKFQFISKHSKKLKRRLNTCSFRKLQSMVEYKARWEGITVVHVNPMNTSKTCSICGYKTNLKGHGKVLKCGNCETEIDRQLNASINLLKTQDEGVWFSPDRLPNVAVISPLNKAMSKREEVNFINIKLTEP